MRQEVMPQPGTESAVEYEGRTRPVIHYGMNGLSAMSVVGCMAR